MTRSDPLNWAVLGTGNIARKFATDLARAPRSTLRSVGSRSVDTARAFGEEFGAAECGTYDQVIADDSVDALYIALPNGLHAPLAMKAMQAGKHVLCEKPFALSAAEAESVFAVADRTGRVCVEAFMYRAFPIVQKLIETIRSGAIGDVRLIRSNFTFSREVNPADARYQPEHGGGSLMDVGCYCVNLIRTLLAAEPTAVHCAAHINAYNVDEYAAGTLRFDGLPRLTDPAQTGDVLATFTCGMTVEGDNSTFISGTDGWASIDWPWFGGPPDSAGRGGFTLVSSDGARRTVEAPAELPMYALEAEAFVDAVAGAEPWITRADTLGNMRTLDRLRESAGLRY